jgi:glycine/D-amino acid oxidase-like deaminating enzyme
MNHSLDADIAVVGGGIIGTASALALQDAGFSVAVIEPDEPGAGTAAGSAGYLHDGEIFPLAQPGLIPALPRMLFDPYGPLVLRLSYLPQLTTWGGRFFASMRRAHVERAIAALASLNRTAVDALIAMATSAGAGDLLVRVGGLKVVRDPRTMEKLAAELQIFEHERIAARVIDGPGVRALEPAFAADVAGAVFFPNSAHCTDPAAFGDRLAARVRDRGTIVHGAAESLAQQADGTWAIRVRGADRETQIAARRVVVAAGYGSGALLQSLGYAVPLASARGYHLMIAQPSVTLIHPTIFHEPHIGATPMEHGLRIAGTMEFAQPDAPADFRRADMLYGLARQYLPNLHNDSATRWMGVRPVTPDSLPAIGAASRHANLYYCFGHGHLGFTQAAVSANAVVQLVTRATPQIDLAPFDLRRFER